MGVNSIIIQKYAFDARNRLINEYKEKYTSKKGDRFNYNKVTYEIANLFESENRNGFELEISSRVPVEEISVDIQKYFKAVESLLGKNITGLCKVTLEDTEQKIDNEETKLRDYIRLKFNYQPEQLYDTEKINAVVKQLCEDPDTQIEIPNIPEVSSIPGKMILDSVRETFYKMIGENIDKLMAANDKALEEFSAN